MLLIYNYATYTFMLTTFLCAVIRYFHVCRPFAQYADYFYPSRVEITLMLLYSSVLQLPYFIHFNSPWSTVYAAVIFLLTFTTFFTLMVSRYFIKKPNQAQRIGLALTAILPCLPFFIDGLLGGQYLFCHQNLVFYSSLGLGLITTGAFAFSLYRLLKKMRDFTLDNFSSEEDFPYKFAYIVIGFSGVTIVGVWCNWLVESQTAIATLHIALSAIAVIYLLIILHPQQPSSYQCVYPKDMTIYFSEKEETKGAFDMKKLARTIHKKIYEDKMYLDPHLSLVQLAAEVGYGRTITSKVCNEFYGGFYKLVNDARLAYANQLQYTHPEYTQDTIARECGFSNRNSFLRVKKRINDSISTNTDKQ